MVSSLQSKILYTYDFIHAAKNLQLLGIFQPVQVFHEHDENQ